MQRDKILSMLGLAARAGKVASGEFSVEKAVKSGSAFLVVISEEASENTKKNFRNMCSFYQVPMYLYASKEALGNAVGKELRASLAVLDEGFAKSLEEKLMKENGTTEVVPMKENGITEVVPMKENGITEVVEVWQK